MSRGSLVSVNTDYVLFEDVFDEEVAAVVVATSTLEATAAESKVVGLRVVVPNLEHPAHGWMKGANASKQASKQARNDIYTYIYIYIYICGTSGIECTRRECIKEAGRKTKRADGSA